MIIESYEQLAEEINRLIDAWQERAEQKLLDDIGRGWPLLTGLTDDYDRLLRALIRIRDRHGDLLTQSETDAIVDLITAVDKAVYRR